MNILKDREDTPQAESWWPQRGWKVPDEWVYTVCLCDEPVRQRNPITDICDRCNKPWRYLLRRCATCDSLFLLSYRHPNQCVRTHKVYCWEHIPAEPCDHDYCRKIYGNEPVFVREEDLTPKPAPSIDDFDFSVDLDF